MSYSISPLDAITDALDVPCGNGSFITPKNLPSSSMAGSKVPLIAFSLSSMFALSEKTPQMSTIFAPTVPAE